MFILKKIIARCFFPVPLVLEFFLFGFLLSLNKKTRVWGRGFVGLAFALLYLFSLPPVGKLLLRSLEDRFDQFSYSSLSSNDESFVICVAGSGFDGVNFNDDFLIRLMEAGRIARVLESNGRDYKLVVSVSGPVEDSIKLQELGRYFSNFGVSEKRIEMVSLGRNSAEEMALFCEFSGQMILVTQAFHIPRFMQLAEMADVLPIPAPAGKRVLYDGLLSLDFIPSADALDMTRTAFYEYLGMFENKVLVFLNSDF